jgi:hypothetical protein
MVVRVSEVVSIVVTENPVETDVAEPRLALATAVEDADMEPTRARLSPLLSRSFRQ